MKKQLIPYLKTYLLIMISYFIISLIIALLCTVIQISSFIYQTIIHLSSYLILIISFLFLFKLEKNSPLIHGFVYSTSYLVISFIFRINSLSWSILIKPLLIIIIFYFLYYLKKNNN